MKEMIKNLTKILMIKFFCVVNIFAIDFKNENQGFMWYKDELKDELEQSQKNNIENEETKKVDEARERNQALKKEFEDAIEVAIDNPSIENVIKAQKIQKIIFNQSEKFGKSWVLAPLLETDLMDLKNNPNNLHRKIAAKKKSIDQLHKLRLASKEYGLLLYVIKGCEYCERFVSILKGFQDETSFQILAISETGENYHGLAGIRNNGKLDHLNPYKLAPILFLVNKDGKSIYPVARGLSDIDLVKENILKIIKLKEKGDI